MVDGSKQSVIAGYKRGQLCLHIFQNIEGAAKGDNARMDHSAPPFTSLHALQVQASQMA